MLVVAVQASLMKAFIRFLALVCQDVLFLPASFLHMGIRNDNAMPAIVSIKLANAISGA